MEKGVWLLFKGLNPHSNGDNLFMFIINFFEINFRIINKIIQSKKVIKKCKFNKKIIYVKIF